MRCTVWIVAAIGLAIGASASAADINRDAWKFNLQDGPGRWWAVDVGAFFPVDQEIKDRFGNTLFRLGFRAYDTRQASRGKIVLDATVIAASKSGSRMFILPITIGFLVTNGNPDRAMTFITAGVGPAYLDYSILRQVGPTLVRVRDKKFGTAAHVDAGITIGKRLTLTGRYDWLSQTDGFDFSGWSANLTFALFRW